MQKKKSSSIGAVAAFPFGSARQLARAVRTGKVVGGRAARGLPRPRRPAEPGRSTPIVVDDRERALKDARAADRALAKGQPVGPLHGVPMTVKESFNIPGQPTTWGFPDVRRQRGHRGRRGRGPAARRRRGDLRQDERADVAGRLPVLQRRVRHDEQPVGPHPRRRRIVGRVGGGAGRRADRPRVRQRHRRQHPQPGRLLRRLRAQADVRDRAQARPDARRPARQRGSDLGRRPAGPIGRRPRPGPEGDRRARPRGRVPAGAARAADVAARVARRGVARPARPRPGRRRRDGPDRGGGRRRSPPPAPRSTSTPARLRHRRGPRHVPPAAAGDDERPRPRLRPDGRAGRGDSTPTTTARTPRACASRRPATATSPSPPRPATAPLGVAGVLPGPRRGAGADHGDAAVPPRPLRSRSRPAR